MAKPMNGIFISYRREDTAGHAGRLFDRLAAHFGKDSVFMDVEGIEAGVDFVETIEKAVGGCDVLLAVIGRGWLESKDSRGQRRLDDPQDFIRLETASALARNVRVIPVLVEGAQMPRVEDLPEPLVPLTRRQAVELRDSRWEADIQALIGVLERVLGARSPEGEAAPTSRAAWPARAKWVAGIAAVLLGGGAVAYLLGPDKDRRVPERASTSTEATVTTPARPETPPGTAPQAAATPAAQSTATHVTAERPVAPVASKPPAPSTPAVKQIRPKTAAVLTGDSTKDARQPAPQATPAATRIAEVSPAPSPPAAPAPVAPVPIAAPTPPPTTLAAVAPKPAPPRPRTIAVIGLGQPTFRDFWDGENRGAYSAKVAKLYGSTLRELASVPIELKIDNGEREIRVVERSLREAPRLCEASGAAAVFVAFVEEPHAVSRTESAYWPELRLTAIACSSGRKYALRDDLSPRVGDSFPFQKDMADTMLKFVQDHRYLLQ